MFSEEDIKLLKGCVLSTRELLSKIPFKNKDMKNKIKEIDNLIKKIEGC